MINSPRKKLILSLVLFGLLAVTLSFLVPTESQGGILAGYGLGFLAILLHFATNQFTKKLDNDSFFKLFFLSLTLRFFIVLGLFVILILSEKFEQLSFTVSFLISYIFHSVTDMIFLNDQLTKQHG